MTDPIPEQRTSEPEQKPAPAAPTPADPPPIAEVHITTAGHEIELKAAVPVEQLADLALKLWRDTRDPKLDKAYGAGFGHTERAPDYIEEGRDVV